MLTDTVAAIDEAYERDPRRLSILANGHLRFHEGLASERKDQYGAAREAFLDAADLLSRGRSPFELWARLHAAYCLHFLGDPPGALRVFETIASGVAARRYPALAARSLWLIGLADLVTGRLPTALQAHERARRAYLALHEEPSADFLASQVAADHFFLGEREEAWADRLVALRGLVYQEDPRRIYSVLWEAAQASLADGLNRAAVSFLDELTLSRALEGLPGLATEILLRRALIEQRGGDPASARRDLGAAQQLLLRIVDASWRDRVSADLLAATSEVSLAVNPKETVAILTAALRRRAKIN